MPTNYLVGEQTKRRIFKVSRQLFYKQGYDETTYDDISKLATINRALIPYYFKNKKNLALLVYQNFIEDYFAICDKALENKEISDIGRTAFYMFGYYRLLKNRNLTRFLIQFNSDVDYDEKMVISKKSIFDMLSIKNSEISPEDYEVLSQMDYGIEKELIRIAFYKEDTDIDHLSTMELRMILSFLGYSKEHVQQIIAEAMKFLEETNIILKESFDFELDEHTKKEVG